MAPDTRTLTDEDRLDRAEVMLRHRFGDRELLRQALTHPSACEERDPHRYYERLEFLGDSVIGFLIAEEIFLRFPDMPEGGMTRIKVSLVNGHMLSHVAAELGFGEMLILGQSERGTGRRGLASALENSFEAVTAALYLDAGMSAAREWVLRTLGDLISEDVANTPENPKSLLQELLQSKGDIPVYRLVSQVGPPHDRTFTTAVEVRGHTIGTGSGRSKKESEAHAANAALRALDAPESDA